MPDPKRIRLSRKKGFKLPKNAVNVARPGKWGNPFIVGKHGTRAECVKMFKHLCCNLMVMNVDTDCIKAQQRFLKHAPKHIHELKGKDIACWCALDGKPCHGDALLQLANN